MAPKVVVDAFEAAETLPRPVENQLLYRVWQLEDRHLNQSVLLGVLF